MGFSAKRAAASSERLRGAGKPVLTRNMLIDTTASINPRYDLYATGDDDLIARLGELVASERETLADVLCHFAEVDARKLYLHHGCSSMFVYATEILGLSEAAAYHRIRAARVARRHPEVLEDVAAGMLTLAGLGALAAHLDGVGKKELLAAARGRSTREIRELVATAQPERRVADSITPIGEDRLVFRFTAGAAVREKLEEARALLSHRLPDSSNPMAAVFERALDALIEKTRKQRFAATDSPRPARPSGRRTRHIPASVQRQVEARDEGRFTFVASSGRRCNARGLAQFHHQTPYGRNGEHSTDNVAIICAGHNALLAEADYGQEHMAEVSGQLASKRVAPAESARAAQADAVSGLVNLGYQAAEARRAVAFAAATLTAEVPIEELLFAALRQLA